MLCGLVASDHAEMGKDTEAAWELVCSAGWQWVGLRGVVGESDGESARIPEKCSSWGQDIAFQHGP